MNRLRFQIAWVVIFFLTSPPANSTTRSAIAFVTGTVSVNGNTVTRSIPVFAGDHLRTGVEAAVVLHLSGSTVQLSENSDAHYQGERLVLTSGVAQVRGPECVDSGPFRIQAVGNAMFRIARTGTQTKIEVVDGQVKISRGKNSLTVIGQGEHEFLDDDSLASVGGTAIGRKLATGLMGGGAGAGVAGWMNGKRQQHPISRKSPTEP
jgi:ferric-dicitrate binding protein FerR (iron transport regulator)